jgi:hypothetical protein
VRRIAALDLPDITPGPVGGALPRFQVVSPYALLVDEAYQRNLSRRSLTLIGRIVAGWDWARFKPPIVAETAAGFEVIDGQHTAIAAASHPAIREIPVMIVEAPNTSARADAFVGHNRDRVALTGAQIHKAALQAGEERAVALDAAARANGAQLRLYPPTNGRYRPGDIVAFDRLYRLYEARGVAGVEAVLGVLGQCELAPISGWHIVTVSRLLYASEYAGAVEPAAIVRVIAELGDDLDRQAQVLAISHRLDKPSAAAVVIFRKAQHGKRRVA